MKRNIRRFCFMALSLAMIFALTACGGSQNPPASSSGEAPGNTSVPANTGELIKISVATTTAEGNPMQQLIYYFQEQVDEILPGRVEWVNYPNSALGSEREIGEMCMDGALDAALQGPSNIIAFAPMNAVRLQDVPFMFQDQDELYAATNEWYRDMINEECKPYGITTMFFEYFLGQEIENTKRPVTTPEDMAGLKVRVYDSPGPYNFLEACGAMPVAMAFSEVYTSLQQGAIDGVYTTTSSFVADKLCEVTKYHTKMNITNLGMTLIWNLDKLESYPQDLQDALAEAAQRTEKHCQEVVSPELKKSIYADIEAAGVQISEVSEEDYQRFVDIVEEYCYDKMREDIGPDMWDKCVEWLEEYRAR